MRPACMVLVLGVLSAGCASSGVAPRGGDLVQVARKQIGVPYRFGGSNPGDGFDCSGLVHFSFSKLGLNVPHSTAALYYQGHKVSKGDLRPGDLVFFDIAGDGEASHVGIYSGGDRMIHAPSTGSRVREENIGVKYWLKRFLGARRLD